MSGNAARFPIIDGSTSTKSVSPKSEASRSAPDEASRRAGGIQLVSHDDLTLDDFFAAVCELNPFASNRVSEPSFRSADIDVPAIHEGEFRKIEKLARLARARGRGDAQPAEGTGAVLLGNPGIGKSHLLSRLWHWSQQTEDQADGKPAERAVYIFLHNLLAAPDRLPAYLLHSVISLLVDGKRRPYHQTRLYDIVHAAVKAALEDAGLSNETTTAECRRAFRKLARSKKADLRIHHVFLQFFMTVNLHRSGQPADLKLAHAAVDWLAGDAIAPEYAAELGLAAGGDEPFSLRDNQDVEHVLIALSELIAVAGRSFIVCIDQCDNLAPDNMKALGRFLQPLIEHAPNLLLIISGVKETLLNFREHNVFSEAVWDRLAEHKFELQRIRPPQGRAVVETRLQRFLAPFLELPEIQQAAERHDLFPIGEQWYAGHAADGVDLRPRDVLTWARDAWERQQARLAEHGGPRWLESWSDEILSPDGSREQRSEDPSDEMPSTKPVRPREELIDLQVRAKLEESIAARRQEPGSLPPDADNLAALVESLLQHCVNSGGYSVVAVQREVPRNAQDRLAYALMVTSRRPDGGELRTGVAFITSTDGRTSTAALRRLLNVSPPPDRRLLVTDEQRCPLPLGPTGQELYLELTALGDAQFRHVRLDFDQHARLDALIAVIGQARSGDLEIDATPGQLPQVSEAETIESLHRQDLFTQQPLLGELLPPAELQTKP